MLALALFELILVTASQEEDSIGQIKLLPLNSEASKRETWILVSQSPEPRPEVAEFGRLWSECGSHLISDARPCGGSGGGRAAKRRSPAITDH